MHSEIDVT